MKQLLMLILAFYYTDGKRHTPARMTRKLDADMRLLVKGRPELVSVVERARKIADAANARRRRTSGKPPKKMPARPRPDVIHIPCGPKKS